MLPMSHWEVALITTADTASNNEKPLVYKKGNLEGLSRVKTTVRVTPGDSWYHMLNKGIFQKMDKTSTYASL